MVVSVNGVLLWKVRDELLQYDIGKLILINPLMNDDFKKSAIRIISEKSKVLLRMFKLLRMKLLMLLLMIML